MGGSLCPCSAPRLCCALASVISGGEDRECLRWVKEKGGGRSLISEVEWTDPSAGGPGARARRPPVSVQGGALLCRGLKEPLLLLPDLAGGNHGTTAATTTTSALKKK
ncbi:hypothetical protein O3P69_020461 [Scylla paramamosain]|uniref:Uncharacterized protein n=1 Tax=Scylla paramamosain TaxID=85552 RepID=A0AAW0TMI7_SCYPA